jgi:hypothetical protein
MFPFCLSPGLRNLSAPVTLPVVREGRSMAGEPAAKAGPVESARNEREALLAQIRACEETIARSREILVQLDRLLGQQDATAAVPWDSSGRPSRN